MAFFDACFLTRFLACWLTAVVSGAGAAAVVTTGVDDMAGTAGVAANAKLDPKMPAAIHRVVKVDFIVSPIK